MSQSKRSDEGRHVSWRRCEQYGSPQEATPGVPLVRGSHESVGPFPSAPRSGAVSHAVARTWPILQVVADFTRLSAVLAAWRAGRALASGLQYPGRRCPLRGGP